jgi:hypothetical protein
VIITAGCPGRNSAGQGDGRDSRRAHGAAPLKPLPEPVDLAGYRVRRQARVGGLINGYHLVASRDLYGVAGLGKP